MIGIRPDNRPRAKARFFTPAGCIAMLVIAGAVLIVWVLAAAALHH